MKKLFLTLVVALSIVAAFGTTDSAKAHHCGPNNLYSCQNTNTNTFVYAHGLAPRSGLTVASYYNGQLNIGANSRVCAGYVGQGVWCGALGVPSATFWKSTSYGQPFCFIESPTSYVRYLQCAFFS
jgi:hypothetical protein